MRKTIKFKLYQTKKNQQLDKLVDISAEIWNHCIALHRKYFKLTGKYINVFALMKHVAKLKKREQYAHWSSVDAQAIQDICQRHPEGTRRSYQMFFKYKKGEIKQRFNRPGFCKRKKYKSFTLKQTGWKLIGSNKIRIGKHVYKFSKSRNVIGEIKTVTVKRTNLGEFFVCFSVETESPEPEIKTGQNAGFDFGLKTFLTLSDGTSIESPEFFKQYLSDIRKLSRQLSRKAKGSRHRKLARLALARLHEQIANQRRDWFFKLAHLLTDKYDGLFFEDLNLNGMLRLWGRKVSDLAFSEFLNILGYVASVKGKTIHFIHRFYPSSMTCDNCGHIKQDLELSDRRWRCAGCSIVNDRDHNAALNILREGASSLGLGDVRPTLLAIPV